MPEGFDARLDCAGYTFESRVRYSETDEKGRISIAGIVDYFQDTSTFQSEDLGLGVAYLKGMGLAWVVNAWQIVIHRYPMLGERIFAGTFPYEFKGFIGLRNFLIEDEKKNRLVEANSVWTLMNLEKGLPARATAEMIEKYKLGERLPMAYAPRKIPLPQGGEEQEKIFIARQHLDGNHHVNNGQYIHIAMGYLPEDFQVGQLRVEYKRQAHLHDEVRPVVWRQEEKCLVSLNGADGMAYAVAEFTQAKSEG